MNHPWHTTGYLTLASALVYLASQLAEGDNEDDLYDSMAVIRDAGKQIRRECESLS